MGQFIVPTDRIGTELDPDHLNVHNDEINESLNELARSRWDAWYLDFENGHDSNSGRGGKHNAFLTWEALAPSLAAGDTVIAYGMRPVTSAWQISTPGVAIVSEHDHGQSWGYSLDADITLPFQLLADGITIHGARMRGNRDTIAQTADHQTAVVVGDATQSNEFADIEIANCDIQDFYDDGIRSGSRGTGSSTTRRLKIHHNYMRNIGNITRGEQRSYIHMYNSIDAEAWRNRIWESGPVVDAQGGAVLFDAGRGFGTADSWANLGSQAQQVNGMWIGPGCEGWHVHHNEGGHVDRIWIEFWDDRSTSTSVNRHIAEHNRCWYAGQMAYSFHGVDGGAIKDNYAYYTGCHPETTNAVAFEGPQCDALECSGNKSFWHGFGNGTTRVAGSPYAFTSANLGTEYGTYIVVTNNLAWVVYNGNGFVVQNANDLRGGLLEHNIVHDAEQHSYLVNSASHMELARNLAVASGAGIVDDTSVGTQSAYRIQGGAPTPVGTILRDNRAIDAVPNEYGNYFTLGAGVTTLESAGNRYMDAANTWTSENP